MATSTSKKSSGSTSSSRASSAPKKAPSGVAVAEQLLAKHEGPMRVVDLARSVVKSGRCSGLKGKTPEATIGAHVYVSARAGRTFKLVDRGLVDLLDRPAAPKAKRAAKKVAAAA